MSRNRLVIVVTNPAGANRAPRHLISSRGTDKARLTLSTRLILPPTILFYGHVQEVVSSDAFYTILPAPESTSGTDTDKFQCEQKEKSCNVSLSTSTSRPTGVH